MAVTSKIYKQHILSAIGAAAVANQIDYLSDTMKVGLKTSTWTITQASDSTWNSTNEVSGTGYTAGGATLGTKTLATASLVSTWDAADTSWTSASITGAANAQVYSSTTTWLMCYQDFGGSQTVSGNDLVIVWNASGLMAYTVA